jgi:hypothetical protein
MKAAELSTALAKFTKTAAHLNQESDSVNSILSAVEQQLVDANLGLEVWLGRALDSTDTEIVGGERTWIAQFMGFAKADDKWCLAVKPTRFTTGSFEGDESAPYQNEDAAGRATRLLAASRAIRIEALKYLPQLVDLMTERAESSIETIRAAKALAK